MAFRGIIAVAVFLISVGLAQTREDALRSMITAVPYPPLANQARIQGDVHVKVSSGNVAPPNGFKDVYGGVEVWIYGLTHCLETESTSVAALMPWRHDKYSALV